MRHIPFRTLCLLSSVVVAGCGLDSLPDDLDSDGDGDGDSGDGDSGDGDRPWGDGDRFSGNGGNPWSDYEIAMATGGGEPLGTGGQPSCPPGSASGDLVQGIPCRSDSDPGNGTGGWAFVDDSRWPLYGTGGGGERTTLLPEDGPCEGEYSRCFQRALASCDDFPCYNEQIDACLENLAACNQAEELPCETELSQCFETADLCVIRLGSPPLCLSYYDYCVSLAETCPD